MHENLEIKYIMKMDPLQHTLSTEMPPFVLFVAKQQKKINWSCMDWLKQLFKVWLY